MKKTILQYAFIGAFLLFSQFKSYCQFIKPVFVSVTFLDNNTYAATLVTENAGLLKAKFYNSGAIYEFDKSGKIISSGGKYKAGETVPVIRIRRFDKDVTGQGYVTKGKTAGIVFNDGALYYGYIEDASSGWFSIRFLHSGSLYTMQCIDGLWKVNSSDKGHYSPGTAISQVFYTTEIEYWLE